MLITLRFLPGMVASSHQSTTSFCEHVGEMHPPLIPAQARIEVLWTLEGFPSDRREWDTRSQLRGILIRCALIIVGMYITPILFCSSSRRSLPGQIMTFRAVPGRGIRRAKLTRCRGQ